MNLFFFCTLKNTAQRGHTRQLDNVSGRALDKGEAIRRTRQDHL